MRRVLGYGLVGVVALGGLWSATSGGRATGAAAEVVFSLPSMTVPAFPAPTVTVPRP